LILLVQLRIADYADVVLRHDPGTAGKLHQRVR